MWNSETNFMSCFYIPMSLHGSKNARSVVERREKMVVSLFFLLIKKKISVGFEAKNNTETCKMKNLLSRMKAAIFKTQLYVAVVQSVDTVRS